MNKILKLFIDFIYGTNKTKQKFQNENPNEIVLASDASKAIVKTENQDVKYGTEWITSQRTVILLTNKRIICGKWIIPLKAISNANLIMMSGGQILNIQTIDNKIYQFGMQRNQEWINQKELPITVEKGKIEYSTFSIIVRIIAIGLIIYWIYERFCMEPGG